MSSGSFVKMKESLMGSTANVRGMLNLSTILVALVMSILVADTHRKCTSNNLDEFKKKTSNTLALSILVMVLCLLLLCYDVYMMFFNDSSPVMPGMPSFGK